MSKIYYIVPDLNRRTFNIRSFAKSIKDGTIRDYIKNRMFPNTKAVGGIKVIYQHCMMLKKLGYDAYPLIMGRYVGNFFGYDLELKYINDVGYELDKDDVIVATEFLPHQGLLFKGCTKVLFVQSWISIDHMIGTQSSGENYLDLGYDHVIACSAYCTEALSEKMGIKSTTITNGIDQEKFCDNPKVRIPKQVLALSRKNIDDLNEIVNLVEDSGEKVDLVAVDGLTQAELIEEYQKADIFLNTAYPEGFSLPPLEAMKCGCAVVGFSGGGGGEFMIDNVTAMVSEDGDCIAAAKGLSAVLNDAKLKERIRKSGFEMAKKYTLENTEMQLNDFFKSIGLQGS